MSSKPTAIDYAVGDQVVFCGPDVERPVGGPFFCVSLGRSSRPVSCGLHGDSGCLVATISSAPLDLRFAGWCASAWRKAPRGPEQAVVTGGRERAPA